MKTLLTFALIMTAGLVINELTAHSQNRPRVREAGVKVGLLPTGPLNTITDVNGVLVGHTTIVRGDNILTGVTAILPHGGKLFRE
jgi:D-aminopeptidase